VIRWLCINHEARALIDPRGLQLFGARVTGDLDLRHVDVAFPLSFVQSRLLEHSYLNGCQIVRLDLDGSWTGPITADGANVKQSIYLRGFRAHGTVSLVLTQIGGTLTCEGGTILGTDGVAVWADGINVGGDVFFRADLQFSGVLTPFQANGSVRLVGAEIHGDLDCSGGKFVNTSGDGLSLARAVIRGEIFFGTVTGPGDVGASFSVEGNLDLTNTWAAAIEDEPACWPADGRLMLDGFTYAAIRPKDVESRLDWLALDSSDATQPYRQLAKVLQDSGDVKNAKRVLTAMEAKLSSREWFRWLKALIGYGYKPGNAVWWLLGLWLVGSLLYSYSYNMETIVPTDKDAYAGFKSLVPLSYYPPFQPFILSLENTFPLVKLGQADKWQPDLAASSHPPDRAPSRLLRLIASSGFVRWFIWIQILLGWLFATLFVAAVSGIVQHG
jgi:hypothetical protein